jgi:hypothetical protein
MLEQGLMKQEAYFLQFLTTEDCGEGSALSSLRAIYYRKGERLE